MSINLYPHQQEALSKLKTGSILCGGVGTGKSLVSLAYFFKQCGGRFYGNHPHWVFLKDLYIITTARKRDTLEWDKEALAFGLSSDNSLNQGGMKFVVDSWNNIGKYVDVKDAFFIFDEQRVVGTGAWVKSFLKIAKSNDWILLSATPGDTWSDYAPVFIANGFYKNITEFRRRHAVYNRYSKYPKIDRYIDTGILEKHRRDILVKMPYKKLTEKHIRTIHVDYDKELMEIVEKQRWNPFMDKPIKNISEYYSLRRRITNTDLSRLEKLQDILKEKDKVIVFYNFDYELAILKTLRRIDGLEVAEWNGHIHEPIPKTDRWAYLVHYTAGSEGWNCIETDTIIFYSQNYSYKVMHQASGRIDRLNTPFKDLYYYLFRSNANIDKEIHGCLKNKKSFNEVSAAKNESLCF